MIFLGGYQNKKVRRLYSKRARVRGYLEFSVDNKVDRLPLSGGHHTQFIKIVKCQGIVAVSL